MFKAYDRVILDYLVKVMAAMKFPQIFIQWVLMLHKGATTCFLLSFLTQPIEVLFSIRQGYPLSMLIYIIYIEKNRSQMSSFIKKIRIIVMI